MFGHELDRTGHLVTGTGDRPDYIFDLAKVQSCKSLNVIVSHTRTVVDQRIESPRSRSCGCRGGTLAVADFGISYALGRSYRQEASSLTVRNEAEERKGARRTTA